jgi:hypothetical protein
MLMLRYDALLAGPTTAELTAALGDAVAAANQGCRASLLTWPLDGQVAALVRVAAEAEGSHTWLSGGPRPRQQTRSAVGMAWCRDFTGRTNVRLIARREPLGRPAPHDLFGVADDWPALLRVHAEAALLRERGGRADAVVLCPCGAFGAPDEVGWMGDVCGPCHDRRAAGRQPPSCCLLAEGEGPVLAAADGSALGRVAEGVLRVWDTRTGRELKAMTLPARWAWPMILGPGGRRVLLPRSRAADDNRVEETVWDVASGQLLGRVPLGATRAAFVPDGRVVLLTETGPLLWDVEGGKGPLAFTDGVGPGHHVTTGLAFRSDGRRMATADGANGVLLWDLDRRRLAERLAHEGGVGLGLAFSPDGGWLAVSLRAPSPAALAVVDLAHGGAARLMGEPAAGRPEICFAPDSRHVLLLGDGAARCWDIDGRQEVARFRYASDGRSTQLLGDGRLAWVRRGGGPVRVWPAEALYPDRVSKR